MPNAEKRVAITGIGMITCLGTSAAECWSAMLEGRTGVRRITRFGTEDCRTRFGGELPDAYYDLEGREFSKRMFKQTCATTRLGLLCAREALADSGFTVDGHDPHRCGVITGSAQTGVQEEGDLVSLYRSPDRFVIIQQMANAMSGWASIAHGFKGRSYNVAAACASGAYAIANAYEYIVSGHGDAVLAIGADAMLSPQAIKGFNRLSALSERNDAPARASRPFDRDRDGFVLASGGAALMLERESMARRRGARIYALIAGACMCSEAYNIVAPKPSGEEMASSMRRALDDAGIAPDQVGYVSAHGASTPQNDTDETRAIKMVFDRHARSLAVSSQKSMTGHCVGGAGAIECAATSLCLYHDALTPTINYETPDPQCDLDYVPNEARDGAGVSVAISNSFAFGGHNATLVLVKA
jgi:3-oxoacyl-[acyl-carrier-protein] synthase II